ncbi:MAG: NUDIX domain-containing protein [archaeon]
MANNKTLLAPSSSPKKVVGIVEALIYDSTGKILLLRRSENNSIYVGKWQLPGGKVEKNESALQAIKREVREEISCNCRSVKKLREIEFSNIFRNKKETVKLTVFSCDIDGQLALSTDHSELKFFTPKNIPKTRLAPASLRAIFSK